VLKKPVDWFPENITEYDEACPDELDGDPE
jgi:hypothetical protein